MSRPALAQSWYASLGPEVPGASGSGFAMFSLTGSMLSIDVSWSGLSGTTTIAHVHCCTATANTGTVGVAVTPGTLPGFPVGLQAGGYATTIDLSEASSFTATFVTNFGGGTVAGAQAALLEAFGNDRAYLNIHTTEFPAGEIRGFIVEVPEPSGAWLTALAVVLLVGFPLSRRTR
jgi:hypothetical protein